MTKQGLVKALEKLRQDIKDEFNEKKNASTWNQGRIHYERTKSNYIQDVDVVIRLVNSYFKKKQPIDGSKCLPLTLEQAKALKHGQVLYSRLRNDSRGELCRIKITGQVKLWKRSPGRVSVPWKHGLYVCGYITEHNLEEWSLESRPFERFENVRVCPATGLESMLIGYTFDFLNENNLLGHDDLNTIMLELNVELLKEAYGEGKFNMHYELYEVLPNRMQEFAPEGYYYGCHEADGEWGYWPITEEMERNND